MLRQFIQQSGAHTAVEIENDLAQGASLFLTRISAWLRLTFASLYFDLDVQLFVWNTCFPSAASNFGFRLVGWRVRKQEISLILQAPLSC